jgi:hypothetical protein
MLLINNRSFIPSINIYKNSQIKEPGCLLTNYLTDPKTNKRVVSEMKEP